MTKHTIQNEKTIAAHGGASRPGNAAAIEAERAEHETAVAIPTVGRIVLVTRNDTEAPKGDYLPAIVQRVHPDGSINACILDDADERAAPYNKRGVPREDVALREGSTHRGWMWKWPSRA